MKLDTNVFHFIISNDEFLKNIFTSTYIYINSYNVENVIFFDIYRWIFLLILYVFDIDISFDYCA